MSEDWLWGFLHWFRQRRLALCCCSKSTALKPKESIVWSGRSNIVGAPVSVLMSRKANPGNCTVTICHSKTENIAEITRQADILIAAIGQPEFVTGDMVKNGVVVIDVGINRVEDSSEKGYRMTGDVDFKTVSPKASYITPVPGGVGPMTIVSLLLNILKAYRGEVK